jgi:hypothetical protein
VSNGTPLPIPKAVAGDAPRRRRSAGGHPVFPSATLGEPQPPVRIGAALCYCPIISHGLVATATPHRRRDSMAWRVAPVRWATGTSRTRDGLTGARTVCRNSRSSVGVILFRSRFRHRLDLPLFPCAQLENLACHVLTVFDLCARHDMWG